jgi:Carboxypeptidase regulatory-like domain
MNFFLQRMRAIRASSIAILFVVALCPVPIRIQAQQARQYLNGKVLDAATLRPVYGVKIMPENGRRSATTAADGSFSLEVGTGTYTIAFSQKDYHTLKISGVRAGIGNSAGFDILLTRNATLPTPEDSSEPNDSLPSTDTSRPATSVVTQSWSKLSSSFQYNPRYIYQQFSDQIFTNNIRGGRDLNASYVVSRLSQMSLTPDASNAFVSSLSVSGFAEQYNQFLLDGAPRLSASSDTRSFHYALIPAEAVENATLDRSGSVSAPLDYAGGSVNLITRAKTDHNFLYILAGGGFAEKSLGDDFFGEARGHYENFGFPGRQRAIPGGVPTARSQYYLNDLNKQEQVFQSRQLKNNLAARLQDYYPDSKLLLGFGKNWIIKKKNRLSVIGFLQTVRQTKIEEGDVQTAPNISGNPYPFLNSVPVVLGQSTNSSFAFSAASTAMLNGTYTWGNNVISLRTFGGVSFQNNFTSRADVSKPAEDTLGRTALSYFTDQQIFLNATLNGDHALGPRHLLHLKWVTGYNYVDHQNPDERNILLQKSALNPGLFQIAQPLQNVASGDVTFTNSSRQWRTYREHNFNSQFSLTFPFNVFRTTNTFEGGLYFQSRSRLFYSDLFNVSGSGFVPVADIFDPSRYTSGNLVLSNFYQHASYSGLTLQYPVTIRQKGNYQGSSITGASFFELNGVVSKSIHYRLGIRPQSISNVVSNVDFKYYAGFQNPQAVAISENVNVQKLVVLPSLRVSYQLHPGISIAASYFESYLTGQFTEYIDFRYYDGSNFLVTTGNILLDESKSRNSSFGVDFLRKSTMNFHIGAFYKIFDAPVERYLTAFNVSDVQVTPRNSPYSIVYGLEASANGSIRLTSGAHGYSLLTFSGAGSINRSSVDEGPVKPYNEIFPKHKLSGIADAAANGSLLISGNRLPELAIQYNYVGEMILARGTGAKVALANGNSITTVPDYRVAPAHRLQAQVAQKLFHETLQISAGVQNLLATNLVIYQDLNGNEKFDNALKISTNPKPGYFLSGTDNTVRKINGQRTWFFSIAYKIK